MTKTDLNELRLLACISHWLTVAARGTYEVGTESVLKPSALRAYNEVQHRITATIRNRLKGADTMSLQDILEIIDILGKKYEETSNIEFALKQAYKSCEILKYTSN